MLRKGQRLSRYEVLDRLGAGGMGVVFRALDTKLGRVVALKVLPAEAFESAELRRRFVQEARAASALNHPHIVTIHDIDQAEVDGTPVDFIAMEEVEGEPLSARLPRGPLAPVEVLAIARQTAEALAAVHAAGIVHRDIKPGNLMLTRSGSVKVMDFGLAKVGAPEAGASAAETATHAGQTATGALLGTPAYMAPEQIRGGRVDARADVFALGVVLYEMLSGRRPFSGATPVETMAAILRGDPAPLQAAGAAVRPSTAALVARCLAPEPAGRFPSGRELADALAACLAEERAAAGAAARPPRRRFLPVAAVVLVALAAGIASWVSWRGVRQARARSELLPEMERRIEREDFDGAFRLGTEAARHLPADPQLRRLGNNATLHVSIESDPAGATASVRGYLALDRDWIPLGRTPLREVAVPAGYLRFRLTAPGCEPLEFAANGWETPRIRVRLNRTGVDPEGMVRVAGGEVQMGTAAPITIEDFWLDRLEVTNRQYKKFVDDGGYRRAELWTQPATREGRALTFDELIAELHDATGRPGPATWELGSFPDGQEDLPVSGVSWYEAMAYARWAGKTLPTTYHWRHAAGAQGVFSDILRLGNFSNQSLVPAGTLAGLAPSGAVDMAGNVREWCSTAFGAQRSLQGGAFDEPPYVFIDIGGASPFDRSPRNGFRCALYDRPPHAEVVADVVIEPRRADKERPVGDEAFRAILSMYAFDPAPLDDRLEALDDSAPHWRRETVSFRAAYGDERVPAYVYLPRQGRPPYQAVVYWPGADAFFLRSSENLRTLDFDFLVRSGRAVIFPVYQGTYERRGGAEGGPNAWRDRIILGMKDLRRAVDYLAGRSDIDEERIAYYGLSSGANRGPIALALEPRLKTAILVAGGLWYQPRAPEVETLNFAPRIRQPVLMINGRYDFDEPYETLQLPLFRLLGTPAGHKRHVVLDSGHVPPRNDTIRESLAWLDHYLGPV